MLIKQAVAGLAVAAFIGVGSARAALDDSMVNSGTAHAITSIAIGDDFAALNISSGAASETVASATEIYNDLQGYKVAPKPATAVTGPSATATLKGTAGTTNTIVYTIKYNEVVVTRAAGTGETVGGAPAFSPNPHTAASGAPHTVKVNSAGVPKPAEAYSNTICVTIPADGQQVVQPASGGFASIGLHALRPGF